jgi:phenylpropionate dioxygenase-like ring-hydroxylating dioxygenase large terminal subunit
MTQNVLRYFHPVLASHALKKKPVPISVASQELVLFRDQRGRPGVLLDKCPHRFAPLSAGKVRSDGRLACPYHGWNFDRDGAGQNPSQPNMLRCDVKAFQVVERYGYLWVAEQGVSIENIPAYQQEGFTLSGSFSTLFQAPLHVALDNFSEDEHTPYVHTRLGWQESQINTIEFEAKNFDDHTEVHYRAEQRPSWLVRLISLQPGDIFHNDWESFFNPVRSIYHIYWTDSARSKRRPIEIFAPIYMVPETETTTRFHTFVFTKIEFGPKLFLPLLQKLGVAATWAEINDDARFIPVVAKTPFDMHGMRLGKFDKPLVHNHKLLQKIYWGIL